MSETTESSAPKTTPESKDPTEVAEAALALISEIREAAALREANSETLIGKLGGRKFVGVLLFTIILVGLDLARIPVAPATQDILLWLYVAFVGGNAVEHSIRSKGA